MKTIELSNCCMADITKTAQKCDKCGKECTNISNDVQHFSLTDEEEKFRSGYYSSSKIFEQSLQDQIQTEEQLPNYL